MSILKRWDGAAWVTVPDGDAVKYWNGSAWVPANGLYYWNGSAWVQAWIKSDPITLTFYPTFTTNIRWDGSEVDYDSNLTAVDNTKATLGLGRFNGEKPYHYTSLLLFNADANESPVTIAEALATRPVVKSATLRLYRNLGVGLQYPAGYLRTGTWTQANLASLPATTVDGTYHDFDPTTVNDITGWQRGTLKSFPLWWNNIYDLRDGKALMFAEVESGFMVAGATTSAHSQIYGLNDGAPDLSKAPKLTLTLDLA